MSKTITIADDVYYELVKMKGKRSFQKFLENLLGRKKRESRRTNDSFWNYG